MSAETPEASRGRSAGSMQPPSPEVPFCVGLADGRVIVANDAFRQLAGLSLEQLWATSLDELLIPDDRDSTFCQDARHASVAGTVSLSGYELLTASGSRVAVTVTSHAGVDADGRLVYYSLFLARQGDAPLPPAASTRPPETIDWRIAEASELPILVLDGEMNVLATNTALARLLGYETPADLTQLTGPDVTGEHVWRSAKDQLRRFFAAETMPPPTYALRRRDGSVVEASIVAAPCPRPPLATSPRAYVFVLPSGTAGARMPAGQPTRRQSFESISGAAPVVVCTIGLDGIISSWEGRAIERLGVKPCHIVGLSAADVLGEQTLVEDALASAQTGGTLHGEFRMGSLSFECWCTPAHDDQGAIHGVIVVALDVTDRKRAEAALELSEARYRTVVDTIPDCIALRDARLRYVSANLAFMGEFGSSVAEPSGASDFDFFPPEIANRLVEAAREVMDTGRTTTRDIVVPAHPRRHFAVTQLPVRDSTEQVTGTVLLMVNTTTRRSLEEQLRQSQRMEAIGTLAGGVAHDFNNHLTVINGYCDLMLEQLDREDPLHVLATEIRGAGGRAAELTQQLLTFGRRQLAEPRLVNLNTIVNDIHRMLRRLIGERIALHIDLDADPLTVRADAGQMQQVLMNLVINARDAIARHGEIWVTTSRVTIGEDATGDPMAPPPGEYVSLGVRDTGVGMSPALQSRVFEPFFTTKEKGRGTGLGLSTVYGIVKQAEGHITLESVEGQGSSFSVLLPHVEGQPDPETRRRVPVAELAGRETIVIAEDHDELRTLMVKVLKRYGYLVLSAPDGDAALQVVERFRGPIHLLLADLVMPGLSGRELASRVRQLRPGVRVLFTSGYEDELTSLRAVRQVGVGFLAKPFEPEGLAAAVRSSLGTRQRTAVVLLLSRDRTLRTLSRQILIGAGHEVFEAAGERAATSLAQTCHVNVVVADLGEHGMENVIPAIRRIQPNVRIVCVASTADTPTLQQITQLEVDATITRPIVPDELVRAVQELV